MKGKSHGKRTILSVLSSGSLLISLLAGCRPPSGQAPATAESASPDRPILSVHELENADYSTPALEEYLPSGEHSETIRLSNGIYRKPYLAGAASELVIRFIRSSAGDLDGDGRQDAAVILQVQTGGSGAFYYLAAVMNRNGRAETISTVLLGDRLVIEGVSTVNGEIVIDLLTAGSSDPMCCPSMKTNLRYRLQNSELVLLGS